MTTKIVFVYVAMHHHMKMIKISGSLETEKSLCDNCALVYYFWLFETMKHEACMRSIASKQHKL